MDEVEKINKQQTTQSQVKGLKDLDIMILDTYFINGFNMSDAVHEHKPSITYSSCRSYGSDLMSLPGARGYISRKRQELQEQTNVHSYELIQELKAFMFADITQFIGLSEDDVKALPHDKRRLLKKVTTVDKTYIGKDGSEINEVKTMYEIHDKIKAIDMIGKHIGFYEAHNQQKGSTIDLSKATPEQLNVLLRLVEQQKEISLGQ